jgi:hypothetical protein
MIGEEKMKSLKMLNWVMLLVSLMTFSGCFAAALGYGLGAVGMARINEPTFNGTDSFGLEVVNSDILDIIAETGKSLGYRVSALSRENGSIQLIKKTSALGQVAAIAGMPSSNTFTLSFQLSESDKTINISFFGKGKKFDNQEKMQVVLDEFKSKLSEYLKRK